jgi:hypothetical protein
VRGEVGLRDGNAVGTEEGNELIGKGDHAHSWGQMRPLATS